MVRQLEHQSPIPLYHQLKELLKEKIETKDWLPGEKIPSENDLIIQFDISRNTVKKALDDLVQDGLLNRIQGKGTFVSKPKFEQPLTGFYSFSKVMKAQGLNPKDIILSIEKKAAKLSVSRQLQISEGEFVIELKRLRCANDEPIILETSYIPCSLVCDLSEQDLEETSLYDYIEKELGIYVTSANEIFEPVLIRNYESHYLEVEEGFPALLLDRIAYDSEKKPVEFCRSIIRGDRCRLYTELI